MSTPAQSSVVELYIYYRVDDVAAAIERAQAMQQALATRSGIRGRLMQRRDDAHTLMEIYPGVTDAAAFETALAEAVTACGLDALVQPGTARHVERFACV